MSTPQHQTGVSLPVPGVSEPGTVSANPETKSLWALRKTDGSIEAGWYLMPLRLFLGVTFIFAALQKLANPNFFRSTSPISIHAQLLAATHTSPIHGLISPLASLSTAVGLAIALGELAVGVGTLLGLITRGAAVGGLLLNLMLFLTVSFHSAPFYTGSDIVFVFAWTPFILAGAAGAPALDTWLVRQRKMAAAARSRQSNAVAAPGVSRRSVVSVGAIMAAVAGVTAVLGGAAAGLGRAIGGTPASSGGARLLSSGPPATTKSTTATSSGASGTPKGTAVGSATSVPVGGSAAFTDPSSGDPSIVIQQTAGDFVAFDAICPHAGCTVAYQEASKIIACPCHGSEFNPKNGDVIRGPATTGLNPIGITRGPNGDLYVRT